MTDVSLWDFVAAIKVNKKDLITDEESEKEYKPFMVNRAMSMDISTILYANEMNIHHVADNKLQFDFYKYSVRVDKRRPPWAKKSKDEDLDVVMEFYNYSRKKAESALRILTPEQLNEIKTRLEKGG